MQLSFSINKSKQTFDRQWTNLLLMTHRRSLHALKNYTIFLLAATLLYLLPYFLTADDDYVVFKVLAMVLIVLGWCAAALSFLILGLSSLRNKYRLKTFLDCFPDTNSTYSVQIDEEKVIIITPDAMYELPWAAFSAYGIYKDTLYVLNSTDSMLSLYWDRTEMGADAFSALVALLQQKRIKQAF